MKDKVFSDRVYCTLLWEFTKYAKQQIWDSSFLAKYAAEMHAAGLLTDEEQAAFTASPEILKAAESIAPCLFIGFLQEHSDIFDTHDLIEWVKARQKDYPFQ